MLAGEMAADELILGQIRSIRAAPDRADAAWTAAGRYGKADNRLAIAKLVLRAAEAPPGCERTAMLVSGCAWVEDDGAARANTYRTGAAFFAPVLEGARLIAHNGAGRCVALRPHTDPGHEPKQLCGTILATGSPPGCCAPCTRAGAATDPARAARERRIRVAFGLARPAILSSPVTSRAEELLADRRPASSAVAIRSGGR